MKVVLLKTCHRYTRIAFAAPPLDVNLGLNQNHQGMGLGHIPETQVIRGHDEPGAVGKLGCCSACIEASARGPWVWQRAGKHLLQEALAGASPSCMRLLYAS